MKNQQQVSGCSRAGQDATKTEFPSQPPQIEPRVRVWRLSRFLLLLAALVAPIVVALHWSAIFSSPTPPGGLRWKDETPSWSPDGGEIVFASNRAKANSSIDQLYLMKADGSAVRRLTRDELDAREPSFSPDGKRIVYEANMLDAGGDWTGAAAIGTISSNGRKMRLLTRGVDADLPTWSRNGRWIAFVASKRGRTESLYILRPDGSDLRRLATNIDAWALAWSPNSKEIAFGGADGRLDRVRANARRPMRAHGDVNIGSTVITDIAWSPDGSTIAYVRGFLRDTGVIDSRHLTTVDLKTSVEFRLRSVPSTFYLETEGATVAWLQGKKPLLAVLAGKRSDLLSVGGRTLGSFRTKYKGFLTVGSASPRGNEILFVDGPYSGSCRFLDSCRSAIFVAGVRDRRVRQLTQLSHSRR